MPRSTSVGQTRSASCAARNSVPSETSGAARFAASATAKWPMNTVLVGLEDALQLGPVPGRREREHEQDARLRRREVVAPDEWACLGGARVGHAAHTAAVRHYDRNTFGHDAL